MNELKDEMTAQEVFDYVVINMRKQRKASRGGSVCVYRSSTGEKCAAGMLISDAEYVPDMERRVVSRLAAEGRLPKRIMMHLELVRRLQIEHDDAAFTEGVFIERFEAGAYQVAKEFGLTVPAP